MSRIQKEKTEVQHLTIVADQASRRIDNYLSGKFNKLPKARIYQMLRRGEVRVNGGRIKQDYRLREGDIIRVPPLRYDEQKNTATPPQHLLDRIRDSLVFEDKDIVVINKPSGIVVHSGSGRSFGVIELLRHLRPGETDLQLVHRLDQGTSGCLLIAKSMKQLKLLHELLKERDMIKQYHALLKGSLEQNKMDIEQALEKNTLRSGERMVKPSQSGKHARTRFEVEKTFQNSTLVRGYIETGRTHQIRVHAQYMGNPVAGDDKYGDKQFNKTLKKAGLRRLFLHASMLKLPGRKKFLAPLPDDLKEVLNSNAI